MKRDLIVVGGGPGGLAAAKTAAEDGLKVLLVERKKNIAEINRTCGQTFFLAGKYKGATESGIYCYRDPVKLEIAPDTNRFVYPQGFSIEYKGPLVPYFNNYHYSPSGYRIGKYAEGNEDPYGFHYDKETFVAGLLAQAQKAGVEVWPGTIGARAENTGSGVSVTVRGASGEQTLEARWAIAADGNNSVIVDSLGLNKEQPPSTTPAKITGYVLEGVEGHPRNCWLTFCMPSINPGMDVCMYMVAGGRMMLMGSKSVNEQFMKHPSYAAWFKHAHIHRETACSIRMRAPIRVPVAGNVVIVGDAGAPYETLIQGAVGCGYLAVKAIEKEADKRDGFADYTRWWQSAFEFMDPTFFKTMARYELLTKLCTDEEVDYLYKLFQGSVGVSQVIIARNIERVKEGHPELYNKLIRGADKFGLDLKGVQKGK